MHFTQWNEYFYNTIYCSWLISVIYNIKCIYYIERNEKTDECFVGQRIMYLLCNNMLTPLPVRTARSGWAFYFYIPIITETNKIPYPKHIISFTDQINLLEQREMIFDDELKALQLLQNISYYRLIGYGGTFETVYTFTSFTFYTVDWVF